MDTSVLAEIKSLVMQPHYPCTAAIQAVVKGEIEIREYGGFGTGTSWRALREDLRAFLERQRRSGSRFLTFFAVFEPQENPDDEEIFESKLWRELSCLAERADWPATEPQDPQDQAFCLHLDGEKIFVVGLHPRSSRQARVFSRPVLVFNAFSQFDLFKKDGTYDALVETTRRRDTKFQGSVNPMAKAFGEFWESIQFSGRNNDRKWKCPFAFLHGKDKPA